MKIALDKHILVKGETYAEGSGMLQDFTSPYSATVANKLIEAGMEISRGGDGEAGISLCAKKGSVYIKPTYGTVSKFGVVAHASSMDTVGVYANSLDEAFAVMSVVAGHDKNDTMYPAEKYEYTAGGIDPGGLKIADSPILKYKKYFEPVYMIISSAEFCGNTARFDGIKFGYRAKNHKNTDELVTNSRSESFAIEEKLKTLMGTYVLSEGQYEKYYHKAMQLRRLIKKEADELFGRYDCAVFPISDESSALAYLTGCPAVFAEGKMIMAKEFGENKLFAFGKELLI